MSNLWLPPWYNGTKGLLGGTILAPQMNLLAGVTDNFNRANGAIAGSNNWIAAGVGSAQISNNEATGTASAQTGNIRTDSFPSNHYSQIQVGSVALVSGGYIGVSVRNQDPNNGYVGLYFNNSGTYQVQLYKKVAGTYTQVASNSLSGIQSQGTVIVLLAEGSVITCYVGSPSGLNQTLTILDTTFTGGTPGIEFFDANTADNWSAGRCATGPFYSTIATDNFNRANGLVSAGQPNWTDLNTTFSGVACNGASIVSNLVSGPAAQHYCDFRNETYSNDQWAQIAKGTVTPSGQPFNMGLIRWNGTTGYIGGLFDASTPGIQVYTIQSGQSSTVVASAVTTTASYASNVTYAIGANGNRISVRLQGSEVLAFTDSSRTTGQPGFMIFGVTDATNFAAGNVHS